MQGVKHGRRAVFFLGFVLSVAQALAQVPDLRVDCRHEDLCNGQGGTGLNGQIEPGERVNLEVILLNFGMADATNVTVTCNSPTPGILVFQPNATAAVAPAQLATPAVPRIEYAVDEMMVCGTPLVFNFQITTDQGDFFDQCITNIPNPCQICRPRPPNLNIIDCHHHDLCQFGGPGHHNHDPDPGEDAELLITIENNSMADHTNVVAVASTTTFGVTITQDTSMFGTIPSRQDRPGSPFIEYSILPSLPCGTNIVIDIAISSDQGNFPGSCDLQIPTPCTPCTDTFPDLVIDACGSQDSCVGGGPGDGDGNPDPGETVQLELSVRNIGMGDATNVTALVSSTTPGVAITRPNVTIGAVPMGMVAGPGIPPLPEYRVASSVPCGTQLEFDVLFASDQGMFMDSCQVSVPMICNPCPVMSDLAITSCTHDDSCSSGGPGDGDGNVDPGEDVTLEIGIGNTGTGDATNVNVTVTTSTPGVMMTQGTELVGTIPISGMGLARNISYSVDATVPCGTSITFDVEIMADDGTFNDTCQVDIPLSCNPCSASPPDEVPWMIVRCTPSDEVEIEWMPAPRADWYNFYQGSIGPALTPAVNYDHACNGDGFMPPLTELVPTISCGDGLSVYFLVVGENAVGEGPYGNSSTPMARPPILPICP